MTRWAAWIAKLFAASPAADKPEKPDPASGTAADMEAMRTHLRRVGTALGVAGGALLSGLGYTQVHKIFPLPDDAPWWALGLAIATSLAALGGAAMLAGRFYGAQRRIPVSTDDDQPGLWGWGPTPTGLTPAEQGIRDRVFDQAARDQIAQNLKAVELRALRLRRTARRATGDRAKTLDAEAKRLEDELDDALYNGAAAVLEHRSHQAFSGWWTRVALLSTILGIIGVFGLADWSQGQRDLVALGKQCGEAKTAIAACERFGEGAAAGATAKAGVEGNAWVNGYTETVLQTPTTEYRVYGGDSGRIGTWVTPIKPADGMNARARLALPDENSVQCTVRVYIPAGAKIRIGHAGPLFHHQGGGAQAKIMSALDRVVFSADRPLPPSRGPCP
jgi:hypothetical protein